MLRTKTSFRHQIQHKRIVTSGTMTINCLVQSLSSTEAKRQGSTVVTGGTSRDFTTRIEGRRTSSFNEAGNRWRPSYIHNWSPPYNHNWRPSQTGSLGLLEARFEWSMRGWLRRQSGDSCAMICSPFLDFGVVPPHCCS